MRAEATADNTSIRVSWQWSRQGVPMCVDLVTVHYQPEGGSLMMYTVSNTTATSATLPNLQCDTEYTISVYASGGQTGKRSVAKRVFLPSRGNTVHVVYSQAAGLHCNIPLYHPSPSHSYWSYCSVHKCLKCQRNMAVD